MNLSIIYFTLLFISSAIAQCRRFQFFNTPVLPRYGHATTFSQKYFFVFGGYVGEHMAGAALSNDLWALQLGKGNEIAHWKEIYPNSTSSQSSQPSPRANVEVISMQKELLILGGDCTGGLCTDLWSFSYGTIPPLHHGPKEDPTEQLEIVMAASHGSSHAFVLLKKRPSGSLYWDWDYYSLNIYTGEWNRLNLNLEKAGSNPGEAKYFWALDNTFYYSGGLDLGFEYMWAFDYQSLEWSNFTFTGELPERRENFQLSLRGSTLVLYGGSDSQDFLPDWFLGDIWTVQPMKGEWRLEKAHASFIDPLPRDLTEGNVINDQLYIFGGRTEIFWGYPYLVGDLIVYTFCNFTSV